MVIIYARFVHNFMFFYGENQLYFITFMIFNETCEYLFVRLYSRRNIAKNNICVVHFFHNLLPLIDIFDDCTFHTHPSLRKDFVANSLYMIIFLPNLGHFLIFIDFSSVYLLLKNTFSYYFH